MKSTLFLILLCIGFAPGILLAQTAALLDSAAAKATLGTRFRNPVRNTTPIVKSSDGRYADKGLDVEILERSDVTVREPTYAAVPLLFARSTDPQLGDVSRANVQQSAVLLHNLWH